MKNPPLNDHCMLLAKTLKIVAHPVRLQILKVLREKTLNVGELQEQINAKQSVTSQHLLKMADKGILSRKRVGLEVFYKIADPRLFKILESFQKYCSNDQTRGL